MRPLSRGTPPVEFSLRISCEPGQQFSFSETSALQNIVVRGFRCSATIENGSLLVSASGLPSLSEAKNFFRILQDRIIRISLKDRIAISIPANLVEPTQAQFSFMPGDIHCASRGWPAESIRPLVVPNIGACVYPEHEYVAIEEILTMHPTFSYPLAAFVQGLQTEAEYNLSLAPVDETLLLAVAGYTQAVRSTQWVWSFLLTVMTLEMLASEVPSGNETRKAVKTLISDAELAYRDKSAVDLQRIKDCLSQAKHNSKKSAVRALVRKYCAPGIATSPLTTIYQDADDCDQKVGAVYDLRSIYVHKGHVSASSKVRFGFHELHRVATESLRHILLAIVSGDINRVGAQPALQVDGPAYGGPAV